MRAIGYQDLDIEHYLTAMSLTEEKTETKYLGIDTYKRWYENGIIDQLRFRQILKEKYVTQKDIDNYVSEIEAKKNETT